MQKKILLSLLATTPVAITVSAHENVNLNDVLNVKEGSKWEFGGIGVVNYGDNVVTVNQPATTAVLNVNGAWENDNVPELPAGNYKIEFGTLETAEILVNGKAFTNGDTYEYKGGEFVITIRGLRTGHQFSYGGGKLTLMYDFKAEQANLNTQLAAIEPTELTEQPVDPSQAYTALSDQRQKLMDEIAKIADEIKAINLNGTDAAGTDDYYLQQYYDNKLFADPNKIQEEINNLKAEVETFNTAAGNENTRYDNQLTNQNNFTNLSGQLDGFKSEYDKLKEQIRASSDYVKTTCAGDTLALDAAVEKFNKDLQAAFFNGETIKDNAVVDTQALQEAFQKLKDDLTALTGKYNTAVADQKAYNEWWNKREDMLKKQAEVNAALNAAAEKNPVYRDVADNNIDEAQAIVDTANENFTILEQEVDGASAKKDANLLIADEAISALDTLLNVFNELVAQQDAEKAKADAAIKEVQDSLNDAIAKIEDAAEADKAKLNEQADKIQELIDAEVEKINQEYGKHDLDENDYSTDDIKSEIAQLVEDINKLIAHKELSEANQAYVNDLKDKYKELEEYINNLFKDTELAGKFDSTLRNILDSIDDFGKQVANLTADDKKVEDNATVKDIYNDIVNNISTTKDIADDVKANYDECKAIIDGWQNGVDAFGKAYDEKQVVVDHTGKALVDKEAILGNAIKDLQTETVDEYNKKFENLPGENNQKLKEAIDALLAELREKKDTFAADIEAAQDKFLNDVTEANRKVDADFLKELQDGFAAITEGTFPGKMDMSASLADMETLMAEIPNTPSLSQQDSEYQGAWNSLYELQGELKKITDNIAAYNAIMDVYNTAKDKVAQAIEGVENKATEPALTYYKDILEKMDTELDQLKAIADNDYTNFASVADPQGTKERMEGIGEMAVRTETACDHNEAAHNSQLTEIEGAQKAIDDAIEYINTKDQIPGDPKKYLDRVDEQQKALDNLKNDVAASFAVGMSEANDPELDQAYLNILEEIKKILGDLDDNYQKDVTEYNNSLLDSETYPTVDGNAINFAGWYNYLIDSYQKSVQTYDSYNESSKNNAGYKAFMADVITTHESIYSYSTPIRVLRSKVDNEIEQMNKDSKVLTTEWLKDNAFEPAAKIYNDMVGEVIDMQTQANAKAEEYYTQQSAEAQAVIDGAKEKLTGAGVSAENVANALKEYTDIMTQVSLDHATGLVAPNIIGLDKNQLSVFVGKKDGIADQLDKVIGAVIDFNAIATDQWNQDYAGAVETIDGYLANLDKDDWKFLTPEQKQSYADSLNAIKDDAAALDNEAKASESMIDDLAGLQERLNDLLANAEELNDRAKQDSKNNLDDQNAYKGHMDALAGLTTDLDDFKSWVEGMAIEYQYADEISAIEGAIKDAEEYVESKTGNLVNLEAIIKGKIDGIKIMIENAYEAAYDAEKEALVDLLNQAKRLYNEYAAGDNFDEQTAVDINGHLDRLQGVINALPQDITDSKDLREQTLRYQGELCEVIDELGGLQKDPTDPSADILAQLNGRYDEVKEAVDAMNTLLDSCDESIKDNFADKAAAEGESLEAVKAAYTAAGVNVIATAENYKADMDEILANVNDLTQQIEDAKAQWEEVQKAHQESNDRAAAIQHDLDVLNAEYNTAKEFILASGYYEANKDDVSEAYEQYFSVLEHNLGVLQHRLDQLKADFAFNKDSELPDYDYVKTQIDDFSINVAWVESNWQINEAHTALSDAQQIVWAGSHLDQNDLEAKLSAIGERVADLETAFTIADAEQVQADVKAILADLEALSQEAVESAFTYGDVNADGEVDLTDLTEVLDMIAADRQFDENSKPMRAADMNKDGKISIADAVAIVKRIFGEDENEVRRAMMLNRSNVYGSNSMQAIEGEGTGEGRTIDIVLNNETAFVAGQFDLVLPAGMSIVSEDLTDRTDGMQIITNDLSDGRHRVIIVSTGMKAISGNEGAIVSLKVNGKGNVKIENGLFGDRNAIEFEVKDAGTSGIGSIYDNVKEGAKRIYDAAGRLLNRAQRGVNIIVNSDGKSEKTYRK